MSPVTSPTTQTPQTAQASAVPTVIQLWRRHRRAILLAVALVALFVLTVAVLFARQPGDAAVLGTDNPGPTGGQAVARVAEHHGIEVRPASSLDQVRAALEEDPEAQVLLYDEGVLDAALERLAEVADTVPAEQRVLIAPTQAVAEALTEGVSVGEAVTDVEVSADCDLPLARQAQTLSGSGIELSLDDGGGQECFATENGHALIQDAAGTTVFGLYDVFTNRSVAEHGNAAAALWTAGATDTLIWYLPGTADLMAQGGAPTAAHPDWVRPSALWLLVIAVVGMIVAGRRHGPVVVEPFPAQVSPLESSVGRARLYERAGQQRSALETLQRGALLRLARTLRTPEGTDAVVEEAARVLGRPRAEVAAVLDPRQLPERVSRTELVTRSRRVLALERDLTETLRPSAPSPRPDRDPKENR